MTQKTKQGRKRRNSSLEGIGQALDFMLAGHQSVIGPCNVIVRKQKVLNLVMIIRNVIS